MESYLLLICMYLERSIAVALKTVLSELALQISVFVFTVCAQYEYLYHFVLSIKGIPDILLNICFCEKNYTCLKFLEGFLEMISHNIRFFTPYLLHLSALRLEFNMSPTTIVITNS